MAENTPTHEIVTKLINWIESTADFAKDQWPDYVAQYMRAECMKSWINACGCLAAIVILISVFLYCIYFTWNWEGKSYEIPMIIQMGCFLPLLGSFMPMILLVNEVHNLINLYVAPKVYILNHLRGFIQ